jgi:hypothetical protein
LKLSPTSPVQNRILSNPFTLLDFSYLILPDGEKAEGANLKAVFFLSPVAAEVMAVLRRGKILDITKKGLCQLIYGHPISISISTQS